MFPIQIRYPGHFTPDLRHLLCNLLQANVDKRFGVLKNGAQDVKQHSWFATIDWGALAHKRVRSRLCVCFNTVYTILLA